MLVSELWSGLSPELNHEILESAYEGEKKLYRRVVQDLGAHLRKRPNLLLNLPRAERHQLFKPLLGMPHCDLLAQNLIMHWLGSTQSPLLVRFLDLTGVEHDGEGFAESFPELVEDARLKKAVETLYTEFDAEKVSLYLALFPSLTGAPWDNLAPLIRESGAAPAAA
jgi:hypothetical protein